MRSLAALALLLALASGDDTTTVASSTVASTTSPLTTTTVAPTTTAAARVDPVCFNDGVAVNGSCVCSDYFQRPNCLRRPCFNGGYNADQQFHAQQCVCPQGFVGSFCEPQKCMAGETKTFSGAMSLRQLGVVFMWSKDVQQKIENSGDDIVKAIADIKNDDDLKELSSVIGFLPDGTTNVFEDDDATSLKSDLNDFLDAFCHGGCEGNLTTSLLMNALRTLSPESVLVVVGNDGIADYDNTAALAALTQQAIAMRQKIVVGLFSPSKLADMSGLIYNDPAHTALRNLAEATQGFVVTPYNPSKLALYGSSSISQTIQTLLPYAYSSIVAISQSVAASPDQFQFKGAAGSSAYIVVRNDMDYAFTTSFLSPSPSPALVVDTGFVKVYKVVNTGDTTAVLMSASSASRLSVWTASSLRSHIAFSSDVPTLDASSPTAIEPDFPNTLVGRVEFNGTLQKAYAVSITASGLSGTIIDRPACQFTLNLGSVTCTPGSLTTLTIATTQGFKQELPFFCISQDTYMAQQKQAVTAPFHEETLEAEYEEWTQPADDDAEQCTDNAPRSNLVPTDKKGLAVALLNTDRLTTTLLVEPDYNIMNSIYALSNTTKITFYSANIFTENVISNTKYSTNFGDFVTQAMNDAADEAEHHNLASPACDDLNHANVIKDVLTSPDTHNTYNYDLILITDKQFSMANNDEMQKLIVLLYQKRVRLFLVSVARPNCTNYDLGSPAFDAYRQLAAQTSGLAVRAANVIEAYQFVDMYTKHLFDTTTALTNDMLGVLGDIVNNVVSAPFPTTQGGKLIVESYPTVDRVELLDPSNNVIATLKQSNGTVAGSSVLFDLSQISATTASVRARIVAPSLFSSVSWRLVRQESAVPALAFTSQKTVDVSNAYLSFTTVSAQLPVFSAVGGSHNLSVTDYKGAPILHQSFVSRENCTSFSQLLPFSLVCHEKKQIYYLRVDSLSGANVPSVHTYPFSCVDSDEGCLNGGLLVNGECVCPVGWTGAVCQSPICMNGGSARPDGTCQCAAAFGGQFCQNSLAACSSSLVPALRSLTRSIMFVVERAPGVEKLLVDLSKLPIANLPNVEYIVVQYYGVNNTGTLSNVVIPRLQSTRKEELAAALQFDPADGPVASTPICGAKAMFAALNMQTTESSELYWITETELIHTNTPWIAAMGEKRSVLRGMSVADGPNLPSTTAMVSLSAGQLLRKITFAEFFTYVGALVDKQGTRKFERRANVIARDDSSCVPVQFTLTATSNVVVTNNATTGQLTLLSGAPLSVVLTTLGGGAGQTYTDVFIALKPETYVYTFAKSSSCKYMLETLSDLQIGYSFSDSFLKEDQYSVARSGGNYMSIYTRNALFTDNLAVKDILSAKVTSVAMDGSWNSTVLTSAIQLSSCGYQFALQTDCSPGQLGTIVQLTGKLSIPGQSAIPTYNAVITTPCVNKTTCQNGKLADGRCTCYAGWSGVNCNLPVCSNGGRLAGEVCDCPPPFNGDQCQNKGALSRAFIMLIDNCGSDAEITQQIKDANTQFAALFDFEKNKFALFGADGASMHDFQDVTSAQEYDTLLLEVFSSKCKATQDLKSAFTNIVKSLQSLEASYVNLIYFSQSNSTLSDPSLLQPLQQHKTNVVTVAMAGIYGDAREGVEAALKALGGSYAVATDVYSALSIAVPAVHGADKPLPDPPARQPSCMHRLQASLFFAIQGTTTPGSVSMQAMAAVKSVVSSFVSDLNTQSSVKINQCKIGDDLAGKSLVTGSYYEDDEAAQEAATFCVSGVPALINSKRNGYAKTITDFDSVLNMIGMLISKPCSCQRFDDQNTPKIMIWMPAQSDVNAGAKADFTSNNLTLFQHIVVPIGFDLATSTVWNKVPGGHSVQQLSPDGANVKAVVQDLWTTICKMADIIGPDVTAEPPAAASDQFWEYEGYEELPEYEEL